MDEGYEGEDLDNIVILNDEDGNEVKFEFLDLVELDDEEYVILLPVIDDGVEEEEILNKVFEIFKERFKDDFDFVD